MCHKLPYYTECRYAECHYAECSYAECHYAECYYAECRGAFGKHLKGKVQKTELFWINWKDTKLVSTINVLTQLRALGKLAHSCYFL
jgi:hypothetical protein